MEAVRLAFINYGKVIDGLEQFSYIYFGSD